MKPAEAAFTRRAGPSEEERKRQMEVLAKEEWTAHCRRCGADLKGVYTQVKDHVCVPAG